MTGSSGVKRGGGDDSLNGDWPELKKIVRPFGGLSQPAQLSWHFLLPLSAISTLFTHRLLPLYEVLKSDSEMTMDPLTAISLAACVVQFVDCGLKFVSTAVKIHRNGSGALAENDELDHIVNAAQHQAKLIANASSPEDDTLANILKDCVSLSMELEQSLQDAKGSGTRKTLAKSVTTAVRTMLESNKIKELEARFNRVRDQVCFHLNATL